jgi:DNA-binding FadR family transcriptional regulator
VVRRPRVEDFSSSLELFLQFEGATLSDVVRAREILEPMLVRIAADVISTDQLDALDETVATTLAALDDQDVFLAQSREFLRIISRSAGSIVIRIFVETLASIAGDAIPAVVWTAERRTAVAETHRRVISALRHGDGVEAEQIMAAHVREATAFWHATYSDLFDRPVRWVG